MRTLAALVLLSLLPISAAAWGEKGHLMINRVALETARANAVYVAGVMGHYVGDGSQPMHLSFQYNGWLDTTPNPKNYTKDRGLHSRYEAAYVNAAIDI